MIMKVAYPLLALSQLLLLALLLTCGDSQQLQYSSSFDSKKIRSTNKRKGSRRVIQPLPLPDMHNFYMNKQNGVAGGVYLDKYHNLDEKVSLYQNRLILSKGIPGIPDHWYPHAHKGQAVTLKQALKSAYGDRKNVNSNNTIVINYKEKRKYRYIESYELEHSNRIKKCTEESIARSQKIGFQDNIDYILKEKAILGHDAIVVWTILDDTYKDMIIEAQSMIRTKLGGFVYNSLSNRNVKKNSTSTHISPRGTPHLLSLTLHQVPILLVFVSLSSEVTKEACLNDALVITFPYKNEGRKIAESKFGFSYHLAKYGINGLFFELDVFIFQDFRHFIRRDSDLTICSHQNSYVINIGLFYVKASMRTIAFFDFLRNGIDNKQFDQTKFNKAVECILHKTSDSCKLFAKSDGTMPLLPSEMVVTNIGSNIIVSGFPRNRMIDSYGNIAGFHILSLSPLKGAHGKINVAKEATFYEGANHYYDNRNNERKYLGYDGNLLVSNSVENYGKNHNFVTHLRLYILVAMVTRRVAIMPRWLLKDAETILPYEYIDTKILDKYIEWKESSYFNNRKTDIKGPCAQVQIKSYETSYKLNGSVIIRRHMGVDCSISQDMELYHIDLEKIERQGDRRKRHVMTYCDFLQLILSIFQDSPSSNNDVTSLKNFPIIFLKILDPYIDILHSDTTLSDLNECRMQHGVEESLIPFMTEIMKDISTQPRVGRVCTDFSEKGISYHEFNCYDDCQNRKSHWGFNEYEKI